MEGFFERETKRVVFTSGRAASRAAVRKDLAAAASTEIIEVTIDGERREKREIEVDG